MTPDEQRRVLRELDVIESDACTLQHRVWRIRRQLQEQWRIKEGFQYDDNRLRPKPTLEGT